MRSVSTTAVNFPVALTVTWVVAWTSRFAVVPCPIRWKLLTLVNTRSLGPEDFLTWRDACQLTPAGRKKFFPAYEGRKAAEVTHPVFGYRMSYARMLEVQARMLAAYVRGELPSYQGFTVR